MFKRILVAILPEKIDLFFYLLILIIVALFWGGFLDFLRTDPATKQRKAEIKQQIEALVRQKNYEFSQAEADEQKALHQIEDQFAQRKNEAILRQQNHVVRQLIYDQTALEKQVYLSFAERCRAINAKYEPLINDLVKQE